MEKKDGLRTHTRIILRHATLAGSEKKLYITLLSTIVISALYLPFTAGYNEQGVYASDPRTQIGSPAIIPVVMPVSISPGSDETLPGGESADLTIQSVLGNPSARQTNNIVNTKAYYDVVFTTATSGAIKRIDMVFPAGTDLSQVRLLEREGIGAGGPGVTGNTLTYFISNPVATVPANTQIRLEFANIGNPAAPDAGYRVSITTRDAAGNIIDGPTDTFTYVIKQIGTNDIADSAVTTDKIADDAIILQTIQRVSAPVDIPPGAFGTADITCLGNEEPTGGGNHVVSNGLLIPQGQAMFDLDSDGLFETWRASASNLDTTNTWQLQSVIECATPVP